MEPVALGQDVLGRRPFVLEIDHLSRFPEALQLGTPRFVLFLACDTRANSAGTLRVFSDYVLRLGAVYVAVWGPDCERLHDFLAAARAEFDPNMTDESMIHLSSHPDENLDEALWFCVNSAWPAEAFAGEANALLAVSVAHSDWADQIRERLSDPAGLARAAGEPE